MRRRQAGGAPQIAVAIRLADAALAEAIAAAAADAPDLNWSDGAADVLVTDDAGAALSEAAGAVVLIGAADPLLLPAAVRAVLPAGTPPVSVVAAVRLVAEGLLVLPDGFRDPVATRGEAEEDGPPLPRPALTPREREVLELLAAGASNKAIARALGVSVHTAKFHVASLTRKLGASGRLEAVGIGLRTGLLMV